MHVTFFEDRRSWARAAGAAGRHIRAADEHNRPPMTPAKRLGVVMDPIEAISYAKDSTLAMLLAAQPPGFELRYLDHRDLLFLYGPAPGHLRLPPLRAVPRAR